MSSNPLFDCISLPARWRLHLSRVPTCAASAEAQRWREAGQLQPALQRMLQRIEPARGQFDGEITSRLRLGNNFTTHAVSQLDSSTLQELTGMEPGAASELLSAARDEVERSRAEASTYSERLQQLKTRVEVELWDMMVRLHLIDELSGVIESEKVTQPPPAHSRTLHVQDALRRLAADVSAERLH